MAERNPRPWFSGLRMRALNIAMVCLALAASILLFIAVYQSTYSYQVLQENTERHFICHQDAMKFQEASDYLTLEACYFVLTGDPAHAANYINEVETTRRREKAVDSIQSHLTEPGASESLAQALVWSEELAGVEIRAMRLAAEAWGLEEAQMPPTIWDAAVEPGDAALSAEEKKATALERLIGEDYQVIKSSIRACVEESVDALIDGSRIQQAATGEQASSLLLRQRLLVGLLLALVFAAVLATYLLIIKPIEQGVSHIRKNQPLPETGAYETRFLARAYNEMLTQHAAHTEKLAYAALHDALTGLYNRAGYEAFLEEMDEREVAVLIVDVDKFKEFNDTYGHEVGDQVLKRVAQVLRDSFRADDFVGRIGGDEFCVIMMRAGSTLRGLVAEKIRRANELLQNPVDGLPKITLSVGVAFGDRDNPTDSIFNDADAALYNLKRRARGGCEFY